MPFPSVGRSVTLTFWPTAYSRARAPGIETQKSRVSSPPSLRQTATMFGLDFDDVALTVISKTTALCVGVGAIGARGGSGVILLKSSPPS